MAIQQRFESTIQSGSGDAYRLKLYDLDHSTSGGVELATWGWTISSSGVQNIETIYDSVVINWDGQTDKIHQGIIGSTLNVTFLARDAKGYGILTALKHSTEFKIGIIVERLNYDSGGAAYEVYWRGVAMPEAVEVAYSDMPMTIDLVFSDGLSILRDFQYVDTDFSFFEGWETCRSQIGKCFRHLPHLALWDNNDPFFYEACDMFHDNHATYNASNEITSISSITNNVGARQEIWYEGRRVNPPLFRETLVRTEGMNCYEVIEHWMITLGMRMSHSNGAFLAISPFLKTTDRNSRLYRSTKQSMVDASYDDSESVSDFDNTDLLPDTTDLEVEKILAGSTQSFLQPARGIYYTHLQGGSSRLFPVVNWVAVHGQFPQTDISANILGQIFDISENYTVSFPIDNPTATIPTARDVRLVGKLQHFFNINDLASGDQNAAIGMQFEVKMKIKVGQYYLKQSVGLVSGSDLGNDLGFGEIVKSGSNIQFWRPLVITSDVEWTTNSADRFSFPAFLVPGDGQVPSVDLLQYDAGNGNIIEYACGFGTRRHPNNPNKMKYDNASRDLWMSAYEVELDTILPPLPTTTLEETGVEITCELKAYKNDSTTSTSGSILYPTNPYRPDGARILGFNMYIGDGTDEDDAFYYAQSSNANGSEMILGGETLVASRVVEDYGTEGVIVSTGTDGFSHEWYSENGFVFGEKKRNLEVLADEHIRQRSTTRDLFNLTFLARTAEHPWFGPHQRYKWLHEGISHTIVPLSMRHQLTENILTIVGYESQRDAGTIVEHNDASKKDNGANSVGGGGGITGHAPIHTPRTTFGTSDPGITAEQATKLGFIDVTSSVDLNNISSGGDSSLFGDLFPIFISKK
jgi:hypothetical protein